MNERTKEMLRHHLRKSFDADGDTGPDAKALVEAAVDEVIHQCENLDSITKSLDRIAKYLESIAVEMAHGNT